MLCGAADEVLLILKNDRFKDKERKKEIECLLSYLTDEKFSQLVNLGKKLTDWSNEQIQSKSSKLDHKDDDEDENMDETIGVKVMIEDEDEDEDDDNVYVLNEDKENEEDENDQYKSQVIQGKV